MNRMLRGREHGNESGMAMITAILVIMVTVSLTIVMIGTSWHESTSTARNRSWGAAVHVAESGVHEAIAALQSTNGVAPNGTITGTTAEGTYQYRVTPMSRNRYVIDAVGSVGNDTSLAASRRLRVTLAPPPSFGYALFSLSDVTTKNTNVVCGDIWANTNVTVYNSDKVLASDDPDCPAQDSGSAIGSGSITAATGFVTLQNNSKVAGDIWTGGYDSSSSIAANVALGAEVGGQVKASSSSPGCADDPTNLAYKVANAGEISGSVTTWGTVTGSGTIGGTTQTLTCTTAPTPKPIPTFTFNPANYDAATYHEFSSPSDFNTYVDANKNDLHGTFYVTGGGSSDPLVLTGVDITGDTTIVATDAPIDADGIGAVDSSDKLLVMVSYYSAPASGCQTNGGNPGDCAIGFKNNFTASDNTAVLLYAPNGPVAFKNSADFYGTVYANNIQVKNNMNIYYDSRVASIVGFGTVTLDVTEWLECTPGSVTDTDC